MNDPFVGTWTLAPAKSQFDPNHRPTGATMSWELEADGAYLMKAHGTNEKGEKVSERPQKLIPDGRPYPVPDFPGLTAVATRPEPNTIEARVTREDGSEVGRGTYAVSPDGRSMMATTAGYDSQIRRFETRTAWDRA